MECGFAANELRDAGSVRLSSLSRQLESIKSDYHDTLDAVQRGDTDVTSWAQWFVGQCTASYAAADRVIDAALDKQRFWERHNSAKLNERQRKVPQRLLVAGDSGFLGLDLTP